MFFGINEGDQIKYQGVNGVIHLIANNGKLIICLETGEVVWDVEPKDVTKEAETIA